MWILEKGRRKYDILLFREKLASQLAQYTMEEIWWKESGTASPPQMGGGRKCATPWPPILPPAAPRDLVLGGWKEGIGCMLGAHFALIQMPPRHKTLFHPDSCSREYFGLAWHGKRKLAKTKRAKFHQNSHGGKLLKRVENYGEGGCQTACEDQSF